MDLPSIQCYKLILLGSFADEFCCDVGGGSDEILYRKDFGGGEWKV